MASVTVDNGGLTDYEVETFSSPAGKNVQGVVPMGESVDFWPAYHGADGALRPIGVDPDGALVMRGAVTTDEGTVRANFSNTSLAVAIGSCVFTNGSATVTGTGFLAALSALNVGDYVKLDADAESAWVQVESIDGDTTLTLAFNYIGTGGTGASSRVIVKPTTGSGGSISVASGVATIASGTTTAAVTTLGRFVDYSPLVVQTGVTVSQRIANQDIYVGAWHENATPRWYAWFRINGTTNTTVICESGRNPSGAPSAAEIESTAVTLPNGGTTAATRRYRVELLVDRVRFFIDGVPVAEHLRSVPAPHDEMFCGLRMVNGTTPASSTNVLVDYITSLNVNKLAVALLSDAENVVATQPPLVPFSYNVAGVIAINTVLLRMDCMQLRSLSVQCTSMGTTGVVTPEWSNDGVVWIGATLLTQAGAAATTFAAAGLWTTPVLARYFQLRLSTATTAGTTTLSTFGFAIPIGPVPLQQVAGTVALSGTTSLTPGVAAANLGKAEDAVHASGDVGVLMLGVRTDTPATTSSGTGDNDALHTGAEGGLHVSQIATARTGMLRARIASAASTNATSVKATAGVLWGIQLFNNTAVKKFFKLHNSATAPTVGTTPVTETIIIPADGGVVMNNIGDEYSTGIAYSITNAVGDADSTAVALNDVHGVLLYK